jgi:hypothetical protein
MVVHGQYTTLPVGDKRSGKVLPGFALTRLRQTITAVFATFYRAISAEKGQAENRNAGVLTPRRLPNEFQHLTRPVHLKVEQIKTGGLGLGQGEAVGAGRFLSIHDFRHAFTLEVKQANAHVRRAR